MRRLFRLREPLPNLRPRYNVAPTQQVPIMRATPDEADRELAQVRWGLIPFWAKDAKIAYSLINARAEGIDAKPSFRKAFKRRRCLIAADGFYVWEKKGTPKQPWRITLADGEPFAFAGLWERWEKAPDGVPVESCTIVTTAANALVAKLHDRMPPSPVAALSRDRHSRTSRLHNASARMTFTRRTGQNFWETTQVGRQ